MKAFTFFALWSICYSIDLLICVTKAIIKLSAVKFQTEKDSIRLDVSCDDDIDRAWPHELVE